ncbi:hypothetical protein ZWY2020_004886 [Hordeum vulgare]|nr:hypothetical protein ZWY2020_004886 [Hordeum vulgare]
MTVVSTTTTPIKTEHSSSSPVKATTSTTSASADASSRLADAMVIAEEKRQIDRLVAQATKRPAIPTPPSQSAGEGSFKPAKETKQVPLDPANPKQCVTIGAGLSPK